MNCQEAKKLIDLRVEAADKGVGSLFRRSGEAAIEGERAEKDSRPLFRDMDAHLDACPYCRAEFEELGRVRRLLATAAGDRPNDREVQAMWTAVQTAAAAGSKPLTASPKGWWARNRSLVVSTAGAAAVLALAFQLGDQHFGGFSLSRARELSHFTKVDSRLPTGSAEGSLDAERAQQAASALGYVAGKPKSAESTAATPAVKAPAAPTSARRKKEAMQEMGTGNIMYAAAQLHERQDAQISGAASSDMSAQPPPSLVPLADSAKDDSQVEGLQMQMQVSRSPGSASKTEKAYAGARPEQPQSSVPQNLKIIKTGELTIQVPIYGDAVARVERIAAEKGGFVADAATREEPGGALVGHIVIRVSPERFEKTFNALKAVGRVASENVKAADVTAEFVDTEARMKSLQITEERLRELIANKSFVDKIASLLEVEKELNRVRTDIEQLQGRLRVMADRVALSTIALTLREPGRTVPTASLSVEVMTLDEGAQTLGDLLAQAGGRLVSGKTSKRSDGTLMGTYQLETTLARFAEVVSGIEALGRVEERQVKDQQFNQAGESWADRVTCAIGLVLFERSRQLPMATLRLEVDKLDDAVKRLGDILQTHDAAIASNQATRQSDGSNSADIRLRVPAGRFTGLFESIALLGRVTAKTIFGEAGRIVGGAAVVPCDLALTLAEKPREVSRGTMSIEVAAFETARQALSKAIAERQVQVLSSSSNQRNDGTWQGTFRLSVPAKEMEAFVSKLEGFGRVATRQISGLGLGDLSRTDPDAHGVIELTMGEKSTLAPAPDESAASIRARVREGLTGLYSSIGVIAYGLVVLLPWLTLAALFGWIVTRVRAALRRRKTVATQG